MPARCDYYFFFYINYRIHPYEYHVFAAVYCLPLTFTTGITYTAKSWNFLSPVTTYEVVPALRVFFVQCPLSFEPVSLLIYITYFLAFATFGHVTFAELDVWIDNFTAASGMIVLNADHDP